MWLKFNKDAVSPFKWPPPAASWNDKELAGEVAPSSFISGSQREAFSNGSKLGFFLLLFGSNLVLTH